MNDNTIGRATYSPDDNKIRLYPDSRLPKELYDRVRAAGFSWAPKQELFVAPMWTPEREDFAIELCGELEDEDKSLAERAEDRADRFEDYGDRRASESAQAHKAVEAICENIPLGQPILVGHHSERHARRDAERIENGMRRAIRLWETSQYWTSRAASALRHAKYIERPDVRARRIKKIEADKRGRERSLAEYEKCFRFWRGELVVRNTAGEKTPILMTEENRATILHLIGNSGEGYSRLPVIKKEGSPNWWEAWTAYDVLQPDGERYQACPAGTVALCVERARKHYPVNIAHCQRWIDHYNHRLDYERAMLAEGGGLVGKQFAYEVGGRVHIARYGWEVIVRINKRAGEILSLTITGVGWRSIGLEEVIEYQPPAPGDSEKMKKVVALAPLCNYPGEGFLHQTKAEWESSIPKWSDFPKIVRVDATATTGRHRVRNNRQPGGEYFKHVPVFLTDAKRVDPPAASEPVKLAAFVPPAKDAPEPAPVAVEPDPQAEQMEAMKQTLKAGVQVVTAPQLFPTPPELAARVVALAFENGWGVEVCAEMNERCRILEPSAGTGNLITAIQQAATENRSTLFDLVAVEINLDLAHALAARFGGDVRRTDFLTCNGDLGKFDRVVMNPPFSNGQDIKHIQHALTFLNPGGRLVAICANGPRQREALEPLCDQWIDLPAGSFAESGTGVNAAIVVINK